MVQVMELGVTEAVVLLAARQGRLVRFYYLDGHTDAITGSAMGGGGKVNPAILETLTEANLIVAPVKGDGFDSRWKITDAGLEARSKYLARKGRR